MKRDDVLAGEVATIGEFIKTAEEYGVCLAIEPHYNTPFQTLEQVDELLAAVPALKVAYDPSHFAMQEIDLRETAKYLDRAAHVHVRDAAPGKMQAKVGEGTVGFAWLVGELKSRGYDGALSVEYLPGNEDQLPRMREVLEGLM
jgi:sugar phosphate isomerase/epimerase